MESVWTRPFVMPYFRLVLTAVCVDKGFIRAANVFLFSVLLLKKLLTLSQGTRFWALCSGYSMFSFFQSNHHAHSTDNAIEKW
jgi:hypothetical protein